MAAKVTGFWKELISRVLAGSTLFAVVQIMHQAMFVDAIRKECPALVRRAMSLVEPRTTNSKPPSFPRKTVEIGKCNHKDGVKDSCRLFGDPG